MISAHRNHLAPYTSISPYLAAAIDYLQHLDLDAVETGPLDIPFEGVTGSCMDYEPEGRLGDMFEGHEKFIDIHLTTRGTEQMGISSLEHVELTQAYDAEKDIAFYTGKAEEVVTLFPGNCLILFPEDLHQPGVFYEEGVVRKIVLKVKV